MSTIINPILETLPATVDSGIENVLPALMISADSHVTEPPGCYIDRIDAAYRACAPHIVTEVDDGASFAIDGMSSTIPMGGIARPARIHARSNAALLYGLN